MNEIKNRSIESVAAGAGVKAALRYWPQLRVVLELSFVRLGLKKTIKFNAKYMTMASAWANRFGIVKNYKYVFSFPGGLKMHRAIGVPEFDNSNALSVMSFEKR